MIVACHFSLQADRSALSGMRDACQGFYERVAPGHGVSDAVRGRDVGVQSLLYTSFALLCSCAFALSQFDLHGRKLASWGLFLFLCLPPGMHDRYRVSHGMYPLCRAGKKAVSGVAGGYYDPGALG